MGSCCGERGITSMSSERRPRNRTEVQLEPHLCETALTPSRWTGGADGEGNGPREGCWMIAADDGGGRRREGEGNVRKLG